ncbi:hypothetical protein [Gardnerella vaginalis]
MNRADLQNAAKIISSTIAKLGKGENVTTEVSSKFAKHWTVNWKTSWKT